MNLLFTTIKSGSLESCWKISEHILELFFIPFRAVIYAIVAYYVLNLVKNFVKVKPSKYMNYIVFFSFFIICNVIIFAEDPVNIFYYMFAFFCVMWWCFEGTSIQKLSMVFVFYPSIVAINFLTHDFFTFLPINITNDLFYEISFTLSNGAIALFWFFVHRLFKRHLINNSYTIEDKMWLIIDAICSTSFIAIYSSIIFTPLDKEYQVYLIALACIMTSLGIIFLINTIGSHIHAHKENQYLKLQHRYYSDLEQNQLEIRKIRHDINNHLGAVGYMLDAGEIDDAKEYFKSFSNPFPVSNRTFCPHSLVNAVIDAKYTYALENEIDCTFNIDLHHTLPLDDVDLCSLLANTLDNAIEACLKIDNPQNRHLTVKARFDKGYFSYNIVNSYIIPVQMVKGKYISSKKDKVNHGLGLQNIQEIVRKYHGMITITPSDKEFSIIVMIPV